jgi:hypothetical protein
MPSLPAPIIPSVLDICPHLRRPAQRAAVEVRRLVGAVAIAFPDAVLLARDPSAAERIDSTYFDHVAADLIRAAHALSDAISALDEPL